MIKQHESLTALIQKIIAAVEEQVPECLAVEADRKLNDGNCALCIPDEIGNVYGKMFGTDKILRRQCFPIAWTTASQVWITGDKTGGCEKLVFTSQGGRETVGPDFAGRIGGQPVAVDGKTKLSIGSAVSAAPAIWKLSKRRLLMW